MATVLDCVLEILQDNVTQFGMTNVARHVDGDVSVCSLVGFVYCLIEPRAQDFLGEK